MFVGVHPLIARPLGLAGLRPQDVFAATLNNGSNNAKTITTGIDLTGGGTLWGKSRSSANNHVLSSVARNITAALISNSTAAEISGAAVFNAVNTTGFTLGTDSPGGNGINGAGDTSVVWTFKKSPKFYTEVVYTGDGGTARQIAHDLGIKPGLITVKRLDQATAWPVWHTSTGDNQNLALNTTAAVASTTNQILTCDASTFTVGGSAAVNNSTGTYLARLWAHDPDTTNGIIQCGSFTTDSNGAGSAALGWRPQWLLFKCISAVSPWYVIDTARGWDGSTDQFLFPNTSGAETVGGTSGSPNATGLTVLGFASNQQYVYATIRSPV